MPTPMRNEVGKLDRTYLAVQQSADPSCEPRTWDINTLEGLAALAREIDKQAAMFGYMGDFRMFAVAALPGLPLLLFVGSDADRAKSLKKTAVHFEQRR